MLRSAMTCTTATRPRCTSMKRRLSHPASRRHLKRSARRTTLVTWWRWVRWRWRAVPSTRASGGASTGMAMAPSLGQTARATRDPSLTPGHMATASSRRQMGTGMMASGSKTVPTATASTFTWMVALTRGSGSRTRSLAEAWRTGPTARATRASSSTEASTASVFTSQAPACSTRGSSDTTRWTARAATSSSTAESTAASGSAAT
mmetsp:Transcript_101296/g.295015  ORF Transcript_101296/g.295015 Transcript_101296/m.295015 type:complete len:205 (+) Transcript_101296:100-714(+)